MKPKAKVYRFLTLKDHIEEFISWTLPNILESAKYFGLIDDFRYASIKNGYFYKGIDFFISLKEKEIPVQITDSMESVIIFEREGIEVIYLPENNNNNELLLPDEQREIVAKSLAKNFKKYENS